nr:hypothetical protein [uncultured Carboxylicivirga sp.]
MRKLKDRLHAQKRKKLWDLFDWKYASTNALSKNHSLKCGCKWCILETYTKRSANKRNRLKARLSLRNQGDFDSVYHVNNSIKKSLYF